jgi:hypothetical protein
MLPDHPNHQGVKRFICRIIGHKGGPWEHTAMLGHYFSHNCPRCGTHRTFTPDTGWYAEFYKRELTKKGYL